MTLKIINTLLIVIFVASGSAKLASLEFELAAFERWGYPLWFMYFTGVIEVLGGFGLLLANARRLISLGLVGVMTGAVLTHLVHAEWPMLILATVIMITAGFNAKAQPGTLNPLSLLNLLRS